MKRKLLILLSIVSCFVGHSQSYTSVHSQTFDVMGPQNINFYTLQSGANYKLIMSGVWGDFSGVPNYDTRYAFGGIDFGSNYFVATPLWLKNLSPTPFAYNATTHTYSLLFTGDGSTVTFTYTDNGYSDNSGVLKFELFKECPSVNLSLTRDTSVCMSTSITLSANGGTTYYWYDVATGGNIISSSPTLVIPAITATDTFYVETDLVGGCKSNRDTLIVTANPIPTVNFSFPLNAVCIDDAAINLTGSPSGGSYSGTGISGNNFNPAIVAPGSYSVVYTYTDTKGCSSSDTSSIEARVCTDIKQGFSLTKLSVFPNPAVDFLNIALIDSEEATFRIINIQGSEFKTSIKEDKINVSELPVGFYFLEIKAVDQLTILRFIKQ